MAASREWEKEKKLKTTHEYSSAFFTTKTVVTEKPHEIKLTEFKDNPKRIADYLLSCFSIPCATNIAFALDGLTKSELVAFFKSDDVPDLLKLYFAPGPMNSPSWFNSPDESDKSSFRVLMAFMSLPTLNKKLEEHKTHLEKALLKKDTTEESKEEKKEAKVEKNPIPPALIHALRIRSSIANYEFDRVKLHRTKDESSSDSHSRLPEPKLLSELSHTLIRQSSAHLNLNGLVFRSDRKELIGIDLSNVNFKKTELHADFTGTNLTNADLSFVHSKIGDTVCLWFNGADLSKAKFTGAILWSTEFIHANLNKADLSETEIHKTTFARANLSETNFRNAKFRFANFARADLRNADFRGAELRYINFAKADLRGATLDSKFFFADCNLAGANFLGATLGEATRQSIESYVLHSNESRQEHFKPLYDYFCLVKHQQENRTRHYDLTSFLVSRLRYATPHDFEAYLHAIRIMGATNAQEFNECLTDIPESLRQTTCLSNTFGNALAKIGKYFGSLESVLEVNESLPRGPNFTWLEEKAAPSRGFGF